MINASEMDKYMDGASCEYYPSEVAHALLRYTECSCSDGARLEEELKSALYDLRSMAENKYNFDYWRVLWNALQNMTESLEYT